VLTVACVLKSGGRYTPEWAMKLRHGVAQNLTLPHRFLCLTDMDIPCETIPLAVDAPGWWSKINLFHPASGLTGPTLYFDLDSLIVGSLDAMAVHPHQFTMGHEYYKPKLKCSTAMAWSGDHSAIWKAFRADPARIMREYDAKRPDRRIGDQAFIEDVLNFNGTRIDTFRDLFGERSVASFKVHCKRGIPKDAAAISYHGLPKMDTAGGWSQQLWEAL
jgi:hypothetical protein